MANGASNKGGLKAGIAGAILAVAVVAVGAAAAYVTGWRVTHQPSVASCVADDAIDAGTRKTLEQTALDFIAAVSGSNAIGAYGMLAAETKGAVTPDKFLAALRPSIEAVAPFNDIRIAHTYFVRAPTGGGNQRVICGSLDQPEHWVAVTAKPLAEQAHLIVEANTKNGRWAFVLWLIPEQGWRVQGFNFTAINMGGKPLADIVAMAQQQHAQKHDFNAALLYGAAIHLAGRGNDLQLGIEAAIQDQIAKQPIPAFLQGKPPLTWKIGDNTYKVDNIGAAGVGDKLYLALTWEISPWRSDADADTRNRVLGKDFAKAVPELAASFAGLILVARDESGTHVVRTVATNHAEVPAEKKK